METVRKELGRVNKLIRDFKAAMTTKSENHLGTLRDKRESLENLRANATQKIENNDTVEIIRQREHVLKLEEINTDSESTTLSTPDFTQLYGICVYTNVFLLQLKVPQTDNSNLDHKHIHFTCNCKA